MKEVIRGDLRHVLLMGLSTGGNAVLGFMVGIMLVRALPPEEYGLFSAAVAVTLVGQELVGRGVNDAMVRLGTAAAAGSPARVAEVFRSGLALKGIFSLLVIVVFLLVPGATIKIFGYSRLQQAFPALMASIVGFGIWSFVLAWHQARMSFGRLALVQPVYNLLRIGCYLAVMALSPLRWIPAVWIMAGTFFFSVLLAGGEPWRTLARTPCDGNLFRQTFPDLWRCSGWGMLAALAFVTLSRMDIFVLTHHAAAQKVAIYNAAWQMMTIIDLGTATIITVMTPKVVHCEYRDEMAQWAGRTFFLCLVTALLSSPLFFLAQWYVPRFLGHGYSQSVPLVRIIYWGNVSALFSFPFVGILYARRAYHVVAAIQVFLLAVSVPAYILVASRAGIVGVAWATFGLRVANALFLLSCVVLLIKRAPRRRWLAVKGTA
ncbi:MAG: lipopolysaccharide biosynthesis protein [Desulfobacteraceae bacterium]|nr:lipopolysaccharide biosynthesis protein [Desulfobacteraceae bacterium]